MGKMLPLEKMNFDSVTSVFWPENDDEKWSRNNNFEIPPSTFRNFQNIFYFIEKRILTKVTISLTKMTIFAHRGISKKTL